MEESNVKLYNTTEAQRRAPRKYQDKTVTIQIRVPEEKREEYRAAADAKGLSLTKYIIELLEGAK